MKLNSLGALFAISASLCQMAPATAATDDAIAFMSALKTMEPVMADALQTVGQDFEQRCGKTLTVSAYRYIAVNSTAMSISMDMRDVGLTDVDKWPTAVKERYQRILKDTQCEMF